MVTLSAVGEIADFLDIDQFQPAKTQFACGFYICALAKSMAQVGSQPLQSIAQAIAEADQWYVQYNGNDLATNCKGMTLDQLYQLIVQIGIHYQSSKTDIATLKAWLRLGYPVIVAGAESGFYDIGLGDKVPYPWKPSGNHIILLTGIVSENIFLVRDTANVTNLSDPTALRPGPRRYNASKFQLISATAIVPPWLIRPPAGFDPLHDTLPVAQKGLPSGWQDDGTVLTASNGHRVILGFREYVLAHNWDASNLPLQEEVKLNPVEESNPSLGAGSQQIFNWTTLEWTPKRGVFVAWTGQELLKVRADRSALLTQITQLESALKTK